MKIPDETFETVLREEFLNLSDETSKRHLECLNKTWENIERIVSTTYFTATSNNENQKATEEVVLL